jgi:hypothetical protein
MAHIPRLKSRRRRLDMVVLRTNQQCFSDNCTAAQRKRSTILPRRQGKARRDTTAIRTAKEENGPSRQSQPDSFSCTLEEQQRVTTNKRRLP